MLRRMVKQQTVGLPEVAYESAQNRLYNHDGYIQQSIQPKIKLSGDCVRYRYKRLKRTAMMPDVVVRDNRLIAGMVTA